MLNELKPAIRMVLLLTIATGLVYPGVVTGLCQLFFRNAANGSLVRQNGQVIGSTLIGQNFVRPSIFIRVPLLPERMVTMQPPPANPILDRQVKN